MSVIIEGTNSAYAMLTTYLTEHHKGNINQYTLSNEKTLIPVHGEYTVNFLGEQLKFEYGTKTKQIFTAQQKDTVQIITVTGSPELFQRFYMECVHQSRKTFTSFTGAVFTGCDSSLKHILKIKRENVMIEDDRLDRIMKDINDFYSQRSWYEQHDVSWRLVYHFTGPDTDTMNNMIKYICSVLNCDMCTTVRNYVIPSEAESSSVINVIRSGYVTERMNGLIIYTSTHIDEQPDGIMEFANVNDAVMRKMFTSLSPQTPIDDQFIKKVCDLGIISSIVKQQIVSYKGATLDLDKIYENLKEISELNKVNKKDPSSRHRQIRNAYPRGSYSDDDY